MANSFESLIDKTVKVAQDLLGDIVGGSLSRLKRAVAKQATALAVGIGGLLLAMVFGAVAALRWLETITTKAWAPPLIVAVVAALVGLLALKSMGGGKD